MSEQHPSPWMVVGRLGIVIVLVGAVVGYVAWPHGSLAATELDDQSALAFQAKDQLLLCVTLKRHGEPELDGRLGVELLGPAGERLPLGSAEKQIHQKEEAASYRFELPTMDAPAATITLRVHFNDVSHDVPLTKVLLAKGHETTLAADKVLYSGSTAALRCGVRGCTSYAGFVPLSATVVIRLQSGDRIVTLHEGRTGSNGVEEARFAVPSLPPGPYVLEVATRSALGEETLSHPVQVKSEARLLFRTDKPRYQTGQVMHLSALALKPADLSPLAQSEVVFWVYNERGSGVFKRAQATAPDGVATVDFPLSADLHAGDYRVVAVLGDQQVEKTVSIQSAVASKFTVTVETDKRFYLPAETIRAQLKAEYATGKPVAKATVKVTASAHNVPFQTWAGRTTASGEAAFDLKVPGTFVGQADGATAQARLEAVVTDDADDSANFIKTCLLSERGIHVSVMPEGGRLIAGIENHLLVAATHPDGTPAPCDLRLWLDRIRFNAPPPNVNYSYYEGTWFVLPDFDKLKPVASGLATGFDLGVRRRNELFALRYSGHLKIEKEGNYQIFLTCDDGGKVWIDDKLIAINDGLHAASTVVGAVKLNPGMHKVVTGFFNGNGPFAFGVEIAGPGLPRQDLSRQVFLTPQGNPLPRKQEDLIAPFATTTAYSAGLAEFRVTPDAKKLHPTGQPRQLEMLGGWIAPTAGVQQAFDLSVDVRAGRSDSGHANVTIPGEPLDGALQLRLNKSIYRSGDALQAEVRTSAAVATAHLDLVRNRQTVLTRQFEVKDGKASPALVLPADVFGAVEVHAYHVLPTGEIVRDSRVVYVYPDFDLKPAKEWQQLAETDKIAVRPGVVILDNTGYPLDPTLTREVLRPKSKEKRQRSELLMALRPPLPPRWAVEPGIGRRLRMATQIGAVAHAIWRRAQANKPVLQPDTTPGHWVFRWDLVAEMVHDKELDPALEHDPFGRTLDLNGLAAVDPGFTPGRLAEALTQHRMDRLIDHLAAYANEHPKDFFKDNKWALPDNVLEAMIKSHELEAIETKDAWGEPIRLVKVAARWDHQTGFPQLDFVQLVSAGPDQIFGTADDVKHLGRNPKLRVAWRWQFE